jgi:hypothetical protein
VVALFVGRQLPGPDAGPAAQAQVVASSAAEAPGSAGNPVASVSPVPIPTPAAPAQAPVPDAATTLATAVAVAEVPRRAAERRAARSQQQRAASRVRRADSAVESPVRVAAATAAPTLATVAPPVLADADTPSPSAPVTALFATRPTQARPWPRAILPGFPADNAFTATNGGTVQEHPLHPFEPRVELQPAPAQQPPQPTASGPR